MQENINHTEIVDLLSRNEAMLSDLYNIYSNRLPDLRDFWKDLSNDESDHAKWLLQLNTELDKNPSLKFDANRFNKQNIESFNTYIGERIEEVRNFSNISALDALSISLDIEKGLIEKEVFKVFETDSDIVANVLRKLEISTENHLQEVQEKWELENSKI